MANQPVKISEEPTTNTVQKNDKLVILYNANTTSPSVRTISFDEFRQTMFLNGPEYVDNTAALANGEPVGAMYTSNGDIKVVV